MLPVTITNKRTGVQYKVDPHQKVAFEHLIDNPRAALFLGMSLSKTVIVLSYLHEMHYREVAILKTLVIAPDKVARITWPDELETWKHLEGMRYSVLKGTAEQRAKALIVEAEIYIIGVNNVTWLIDHFRGKLPFDCIVIDELDLFKSRGSKRFKALRKAIKHIPYRVGMTGTPQPNGLTDLWAEMFLLDDGERLGTTWGSFVDKYFTTKGNGMIVYKYIPREGAVKQIAQKIRDIALTMRTQEIIKLPPCHFEDELIELSDIEEGLYRDLEMEYVLPLLEEEAITVKGAADLTQKLSQITSGAVYWEDGKSWSKTGESKIQALSRLLEKYKDENILLVYQFRHEVERILEAFPFARLLDKKVETFREWNEGKIRLLLVHPASAGHGLNLQFGGRRLVWFSMTWNLGHYLQTNARLVRRGQEREVYIHRLIAKGTIDEKMRKRVEGKDDNQTFLMRTIKELRAKYER